jgi:hypothetical protein
MGIATETALPDELLVEPKLAPPDSAIAARLRERHRDVAHVLERYAQSANVQLLRSLAAQKTASVVGGYSEQLGRPFLLSRMRDGDHELRSVVVLPAGTATVELAASDDVAARIPALLASRPRALTIVGRLRDAR